MMCLFSLFHKKFQVRETELQNTICYMVKKNKTKKIKLNKELVLPQNCHCVFCYNAKPYDVFVNANTYVLNGNSLPELFKAGGFNKPNRKNYISPYFHCNIWYVPLIRKEIELEIKKIVVKDKEYGKQKTSFKFNIQLQVVDTKIFIKNLLYSFPRSNTKIVDSNIKKWFYKDLRKWIIKRDYTFSDIIRYTKGYNDELTKILKEKYLPYGLEIKSVNVVDVIIDEKILQEILNSKKIASNIERKLKKFDFQVYNDGVEVQKEFEMSRRQMIGSLQEKYYNERHGIKVEKDNSEYKITTLAGNKDENGLESEEKKEVVGKMCVYCGKLVPSDSTFCPYCGNVCE